MQPVGRRRAPDHGRPRRGEGAAAAQAACREADGGQAGARQSEAEGRRGAGAGAAAAQAPAPAAPAAVAVAAAPRGRSRQRRNRRRCRRPAYRRATPRGRPPPRQRPKDSPATTDLAVERQLDLARDSEWLDRLARDIARAGASDEPLRFRLHPQTLGSLHVELQQGDHGTAVRLTVETEAARQILADAQPRLAAEARAQGVRIAETHVDLSGSGRHAPGDQRRQDDARQTPLIRTAPRRRHEAAPPPVRPAARASDRYA